MAVVRENVKIAKNVSVGVGIVYNSPHAKLVVPNIWVADVEIDYSGVGRYGEHGEVDRNGQYW